jgi:hypothetical protein
MRLHFLTLLLAGNADAFSPPKSITWPSSHITHIKSRNVNRRTINSPSQLHNLGRNYLDSINEEENNRRNFRNDRASGGQGNNSGYFNYGGGAGTAIRPEGRNYGPGGWNQPSGAPPKIVSIKQPQDLLDFVIQDERLSVGESILLLLVVLCLFNFVFKIDVVKEIDLPD